MSFIASKLMVSHSLRPWNWRGGLRWFQSESQMWSHPCNPARFRICQRIKRVCPQPWCRKTGWHRWFRSLIKKKESAGIILGEQETGKDEIKKSTIILNSQYYNASVHSLPSLNFYKSWMFILSSSSLWLPFILPLIAKWIKRRMTTGMDNIKNTIRIGKIWPS